MLLAVLAVLCTALQVAVIDEEQARDNLQALESASDVAELAREAQRAGDEEAARSLFEQAADALTELAQITDQSGDSAFRARAAGRLGRILVELQRYEDAASELSLAMEFAGAPSDPRALADSAMTRGTCLIHLARPSAAARDFELAEALYSTLGDTKGAARAASNASGAYEVMSRYSDALEASARALRLFEEIDLGAGVAHVLINRSVFYSSLHRFDEALLCLDESEAFFAGANAPFGLGRVALHRASILRDLNQPERALRELDVAEKHLTLVARRDQLAWATLTRAELLHENDRTTEAALRACDRAVDLFQLSGNERKLADSQLVRAGILKTLGRTEEALLSLDRAVSRLQEQDDRSTLAAVHEMRGSVLAARGLHRKAMDSFLQALDLAEDVLLEQAQRLGHKSSEGARTRISDLPSLCFASWAKLDSTDGVSQEELNFWHDVVYRAVQLVYGLNVAEALGGANGGLTFSADSLKQLRLLEREQRQLSLRRNALLLAGDVWEDEWDQVQRRIRAASDREAALVQRARMTDEDVLRPARGVEVRAAIAPRTALVEFVMSDADSPHPVFCAVSTSAATTLLRLGDHGELVRMSAAITELLSAGAHPDSRLLRQLGSRLLDPVLQHCPSDLNTLLVSAQGALAKLPFEVLLTDDAAPGSPSASWPYLISAYDVAYVHSGTVLRDMQRREWSPSTESLEFVGFAHSPTTSSRAASPAASPSSPESIPAALSEALTVARLFARPTETAHIDANLRRLATGMPVKNLDIGGEHFRLLLQQEASESNLKARSGLRDRILHITCHGNADVAVPALSRLQLAPSATPSEDGNLFARELALLDLSVQLCVLSGCVTGDGALSTVEGVSSLSRAALIAGAGAVVATLWPVPDEASRELMVAFYRELLEGKATRVSALAEAKRKAIARGLPASAWAGFLLWDARPAN